MKAKRFFADPYCERCGGSGMFYKHDPECEKCAGCGKFVKGDVEVECFCCDNSPPAVCECGERVRLIQMTSRANLPSDYASVTVAGYKPEKNNQSEANARATAIQWIKNYTRKCHGLVIAGAPGNGKTHLLVAIGKALIQQHSVQPLFMSTTAFIRDSKARMNPNKDVFCDDLERSEMTFNQVADSNVLLLDDLGAERQTDYTTPLLCELLEYRSAEGLTTLVTTNFAPAEIRKTYGDRFYDRLFDMADLVLIEGPSRRKGVKA